MSNNKIGYFVHHNAQRTARSDDTTMQHVPPKPDNITPGAELKQVAAYFTPYFCPSEHEFANYSNGTRDKNTPCAKCGKTIEELCQLWCEGKQSANRHELVHELIKEKRDAEARLAEAVAVIESLKGKIKQENP